MEIGLYVPLHLGADYEDQLRIALEAERYGFAAFMRPDHFLPVGNLDGLPGPTDAWVTLTGLARETQRIRLGTLVSCATFRLPGPMAIAAAQVDAMSNGRLLFGLGAGWFELEHAAYGVPFFERRERFERLEEQLAIIRGLWMTPVGETFSFHGKHFVLEDSPALPKPVQRPHPPIIVGGSGAIRTPQLAARFADEFNLPPFHSLERAQEAAGRARAACEQIGRDPASLAVSALATTFCGSTQAELDRRGKVAPNDFANAELCGTPEEICAGLHRYAELGAARVYLRVMDIRDIDQIALLGTEVLPEFVAGEF